MQLTEKLTLASQSKIRADVLTGAGLNFDVKVSGVDEDALKQNHSGTAEDLAVALAAEKAKAVTTDGLVLGADQILECEGRLFDKPKSMAEARANLQLFRGKTHYLVGGVVLVKDKQIMWRHSGRVRLTMRDFSDRFLGLYLDAAGPQILASVGCYQLEGLGAHLFSEIDGDYFSILGLPLLPVLDALRAHGGLPA